MKKHIFYISIIFIGLISCSRDAGPLPDFGYNYFPEQVGAYIVYDVDSIYYDDFNNRVDTFKFQLKEKVESFFYDNENRKTMRIERYIKNYSPSIPYSSMAWTLKNVWMANKTNQTAEKVEDNIRYTKLVFPIKESQVWNGNAKNTLDQWNYSFAFIDRRRTIGNTSFDSVLQVTQFDDKQQNLVQHQNYIELYARNTGLIYKKVIDVKSQPGNPIPPNFFQTPIMQRITSGLQYTMTYNSSGIE